MPNLILRNWGCNTDLRPAAVGPYCTPNFSEFGSHLLMRPRQTHRIPSVLPSLWNEKYCISSHCTVNLLNNDSISCTYYIYSALDILHIRREENLSLYAWCNNSHTACSSYLKTRYLDVLGISLSATSELELEPPRNNIYHWVIYYSQFLGCTVILAAAQSFNLVIFCSVVLQLFQLFTVGLFT